MRLRDLEPGGVYAWKDRAKAASFDVCVLLDTEPWCECFEGVDVDGKHYAPHPRVVGDVTDGPRLYRDGCPADGRIRVVPVAAFVPVLTLADGRPFRTRFTFAFHARGTDDTWRSYAVDPHRIMVEVEPKLLTLTQLVRRIG